MKKLDPNNTENKGLIYRIKTATNEKISTHLKKCNNDFSPPLSERVNIDEYAKKISEKSVTLEAWSGNLLAGLIAIYLKRENQTVFITDVSVLKNFTGLGIASALLKKCIGYVRQNNFNEIRLEVSKDNNKVIALYKKFGFIQYDVKDGSILMGLKIS